MLAAMNECSMHAYAHCLGDTCMQIDRHIQMHQWCLCKASFSWVRKVFEIKSLHIRSIKYRLITKLITEFVCKLRDESNEPN